MAVDATDDDQDVKHPAPNVIRVAIAYLAGSWLAIQVLETLFPILGLAETSIQAVVILLAIGFVPAVILAWVFQLTPEGLGLDADVDRAAPSPYGKALDRAIIVLLDRRHPIERRGQAARAAAKSGRDEQSSAMMGTTAKVSRRSSRKRAGR